MKLKPPHKRHVKIPKKTRPIRSEVEMTKAQNTCYIERSAVREMILSHPNWQASSLLGLVDGLKIFNADDPAAQADAPGSNLSERIRVILQQTLRSNNPNDYYPGEMVEQIAGKIAAVIGEPQNSREQIIEECALAAEAQAQTFLSPQYASNQPFGSLCERFACEEVAKAIRALAVTRPDDRGGK
jgi:hypothetical protein